MSKITNDDLTQSGHGRASVLVKLYFTMY